MLVPSLAALSLLSPEQAPWGSELPLCQRDHAGFLCKFNAVGVA